MENKIINSHIENKRETPNGVSLLFFILLSFSVPKLLTAQTNTEYDLLNGLCTYKTENLNSTEIPLLTFYYTFNAILNGTKESCENAIENIKKIKNNDNYSSVWINLHICILNAYEKQYSNAAFYGFKLLNSISTFNKQDSIEPEIKILISLIENIKNKAPHLFKTISHITFGDTKKIINKPTRKTKLSKDFINTLHLVNSIILKQKNIKIEEPKSLIPRLIYTNYLLKTKNTGLALKTLKSIDTSRLTIPWYYYLKGKSLMGIGNYDLAKYNFNKYITLKQTGSFIKASLLRTKWINIVTNTPDKQLDKKILTRGNTLMYIDQQALKELNRKYIPILLEIRILYDAGNYKKAEQKLSEVKLKNINNNYKSEYYYLKAKITSTYNTSQALKLFINSTKCKNIGTYYNKQAALDAAKLFIKKQDIKNAKFYLNKAKQTESIEYSESINTEAQFLLDSLPQ